jgi:GTP-binding protein EngB required for normal cell division
VCNKAFPIEPLGFWPLPGYGFFEEEVKKAQERFQESYFKDEKGTWCTCYTFLTLQSLMFSLQFTGTSRSSIRVL